MTGFTTRATTDLTWKDLVLTDESMAVVREIVAWSQRGRTDSSGHTSTFDGPSGTGKTLTAALIGKEVGAEVHTIDLPAVASRYIGETEKNLATLFDRAEREGWILFFDEADALFGKRTDVKDSHDRYANQEVSYLLQRIEDHGGLVILATNLDDHLDDDVVRARIQSVVPFPLPDPPLRERLWRSLLEARGGVPDGVDVASLADRYELTGRAIDRSVRASVEIARSRGRTEIGPADLLAAIDDAAR
jgi:SpoVK/Ycf46/Vps4 family AAA+-type ATPase